MCRFSFNLQLFGLGPSSKGLGTNLKLWINKIAWIHWSLDPHLKSLDIISTTNLKCVVHFKLVQHGPQNNQHENMSCFDGIMMFVLANQKSHTTKLEPWNLPPIETYYVSTGSSTRVSMPMQFEPSKCVTCQELCFNPMHPSSMFLDVIPIHAPWPTMKF